MIHSFSKENNQPNKDNQQASQIVKQVIRLSNKASFKTKKEKDKLFGNRIKQILENKKMTTQELSDLSGVLPSHLSRIINGKRKCISLPIAFKLAKALDKSIEEIFIYRQTNITETK